jgi:hypothetical protein
METSNSSWKSRLLDEEKDLQRIRAELKVLSPLSDSRDYDHLFHLLAMHNLLTCA